MRRALLLGLIGLFLSAPPLEGQTAPFGKNKIQYSQFDWRVLRGDHIDLYYYPEGEELARIALAYAEESYGLLERRFRHHPFRRIPLVIYSSFQDFEQTNLTPGFIPEGVLGFTEFLKRRVAVPFRGDYDQFRNTLRHELVHVFHLSKLSEVYALHGDLRSAGFPFWWSEGLAEYWSGPQDADDEMVIRDLVLAGLLPPLRQFTYSANFLAYPLGGELFHYLKERFGEEHIAEMYDEIWKYNSFEEAFARVYGVRLEELDAAWRYHLQQRFFPLYQDRAPLSVAAEPLLRGRPSNFKPYVGTLPGDSVARLFYFSPRTGYMNLYQSRLASPASTERVLVEGERSAQFESFRAFDSRIDLSRGVIALVSKYLERDALLLFDAVEERVVGRYQWDDLNGLQSPSFSPDGRSVVFVGLTSAGFSDLYRLDFDTGKRTRLTSDRYEEEDPDWSPHGDRIVFASDRTPAGGAEGSRNLFLLDLETGAVRYLTYGDWRDTDPRWSHAGDRIAFASDRNGVFEIFTVEPDGTGQRLTNFAGTGYDPEWLPDDEGIVFTGYHRATVNLYLHRIDRAEPPPERIALRNPMPPASDGAATSSVSDGGTLPRWGGPSEEAGPAWDWAEADTVVDSAEEEDYSPFRSFSLDFAGGDALIAPGVGSAQGIQFLGSDMLGNHIVFASLAAIQGDDFRNLSDAFSGQVLYLNLARRLNLGGAVYRYTGLFRDVSFDVYRENSYGGYFLASYPLSKFSRLELQLGLEHSDRVDEPDFLGNRDTRSNDRDLTREGVLTRNFLSYIRDNTLWLPTGPIDGGRMNVTAGLVTDLSNSRAESAVFFADVRRYFRTSTLSAIGVRGFAYFSDGAIPSRAVLGGPHLLRGYPRWSLAGSRLWLLNTEWRFPLIHSITFNLPFGPLTFPGVQAAPFADLGSSWLDESDPEGPWGSYGVGFRMSLGFAFVLRLDVGRRFTFGDDPPVAFRAGEDFSDGFVDFFFGFNF